MQFRIEKKFIEKENQFDLKTPNREKWRARDFKIRF